MASKIKRQKANMKILCGWLMVLSLFAASAHADIVTLNGNSSNYRFIGTNTYYIAGTVYISGTATIEAGAVIKSGWDGSLTAEDVDCQTSSNHPVIFAAYDDDRFGESLPDSTGSPDGYSLGLEIYKTSGGVA